MTALDSETIAQARVLWQYMASFRSVGLCDAVVVCCSYDLRVCDYACELINKRLSARLVMSGKTGKWTRHLWARSEAEVFKARAIENGIPESAILVEDQSRNFGENVSFTKNLLGDAKTVTFVTKPAAVLRLILTVQKQWPEGPHFVGCPDHQFPDDVSQNIGVLAMINEMVGHVDRIQRYPALGFQVPHVLPQFVTDACEYLMHHGFTGQLMPKYE